MIRLFSVVLLASCVMMAMCCCAFGDGPVKPGEYVPAEAAWLERTGGVLLNIPGQTSFFSNGSLTFPIKVAKAAQYKILIIAFGSVVKTTNGELGAIMAFSLDGQEICRWTASPGEAVFSSTPLKLKPGTYKASISFVNDYSDTATNQDLNLFVKGFAFGAVANNNANPDVQLAGKPLSEYGAVINGIPSPKIDVVKKKAQLGIPPYYPPVKKLTYKPRIIPADQIVVNLKNGLKFNLKDYDKVVTLDGVWKCSGLTNSKEPFDVSQLSSDFAKRDFDDSHWDDINVPNNWYDKYNGARQTGAPYVRGWYRRTFDAPAQEQGKSVTIHFGVIGYEARLYVNGEFAGTHHGDFTPWNIDITKYVKFGESNLLAIDVLSDVGAVPPVKHVYGSQWAIDNIKGGLWQNVSLRYLPNVYVSRALVTPNISKSSIRIDYWITNDSDQERKLQLGAIVQSAIKSDAGAGLSISDSSVIVLVPGENKGYIEVKLKKPTLWTPENPYLYHAILTLSDSKQVVAAHAERFGFRDFKVIGPNFYLNGKRVYLFGENLASVGFSGVGGDQTKEAARIAKILLGYRERGYVIVRTPHMPIVPLVLDVADEVGLMVFDEWGWAFSNSLDQNVFERNNLAEVTEWVYRDYNHPAVAMWSCGNEVVYGGYPFVYEQLNKQVELVRKLDISGRPVSSFSGGAADYGTEKLTADLLDLHTYIGLCIQEWTRLEDRLADIFKTDIKTYGTGGKLNVPFIVWECVGFSWGGMSDPGFRPGDIDAYADYAARPTNWGQPNGIGFGGTLGLAASLDPDRGWQYGEQVVGKRILESLRYHDAIQGYAPWFLNPGLDAATLWNQRTLCGLRGPNNNGIVLQHPFAGRTYAENLFVVNSQNKAWTNLNLVVSLLDRKGHQYQIGQESINKLAAWQKLDRPINLAFAKNIPAGQYQLRMKLSEGTNEVSRNFYNIYIQNQSILNSPIKTSLRVAVLKPEDDPGSKLVGILADLHIDAKQISDVSGISNYDVLIVPPADKTNSVLNTSANRKAIMKWVSNGGLVLALEQNYTGKIWFGQTITDCQNTLTDLALPQHPVFAGLTQQEFDTWDNNDYGSSIKRGMAPFTKNAVATRSPQLGTSGVFNAIAEGSIGKGRVILSQLSATSLWNKDSAATTYLRNLLSYVLSGKPADTVRPWLADREEVELSLEEAVPVDLKPYTNRGFADDIAADEKGGWTDQGNNDFSTVQVGLKTLNGVPFNIIDPASNNNKSCIVLKGANRQYFPASVNSIKIGLKVSHLYFLHALAWGGASSEVAHYQVNYTDGSTVNIPIIDGQNIADWFTPGSLPEAESGIATKNPAGFEVRLWLYGWKNPKPSIEIQSLDFISNGNGPVPVLAAITGRKVENE